MGSKRSARRMAALRDRFDAGLAERDITGEVADQIWDKLAAFANYGFPESHSVSFAYLVYSSSWLKLRYPAAFCAALLNAQPMGFYSPQSLVQDARRHGVEVLTPDLDASDWCATLELLEEGLGEMGGVGPPETWGHGGPAVRLGLSSVRGIGDDLAKEIAAGRPYSNLEDLARRVSLTRAQLEALATSGAFGCFETEREHDRRQAIWAAGAAAQIRPDRLPGIVTGMEAPQLPGMDDWEEAVADLWSTGVSPDGHPTRFLRTDLDRRGAVTATELRTLADGSKVLVAGIVTHRQRPATAAGVTFINLEDETGLINVVVSRGCWQRYRVVARSAPALLISGRLERSEDEVINVVATKLELLPVVAELPARNFR
jgi:error-prone DNA polymerase